MLIAKFWQGSLFDSIQALGRKRASMGCLKVIIANRATPNTSGPSVSTLKTFRPMENDVDDLKAAVADFLAYAGADKSYPFNRLQRLFDEQRAKARNQDDRDYWKFLSDKLATLLVRSRECLDSDEPCPLCNGSGFPGTTERNCPRCS